METHAPVFVRAKLDSIRTCMFSIYEQPPQRNCASRNQERASSYDDHHRHHRHHRHHSLPRRKNGEWMTREALLVPAEFVEGRSLNTLCNNLQHCVKAMCNTLCNTVNCVQQSCQTMFVTLCVQQSCTMFTYFALLCNVGNVVRSL